MHVCTTESRPPAGLSPRVAEVVQAIIEARVFNYGGPVTIEDVAFYYDASGQADVDLTATALIEAIEAGMADHTGPYWYATRAAYRLRDELEAWFYG